SLDLYSTNPSFSKLICGAWLSITWNDPSEPGKVAIDTLPSKTLRSGVSISRNMFNRVVSTCYQLWQPAGELCAFGFRHHSFALFDGLLNVTHQVESHFWEVVVFTIHDRV